MNGTLSTATRIVPRSSLAITSPHMAVRAKSYIPKPAPAKIETEAPDNRRRLLAEMSHQIVFGFATVAGSAHAALPSNITISQNRGDASAREPRTYHGRGFSLLAAPGSCSDPSAACAKSDGSHLWSAADLTTRSVRCYHCRAAKCMGRAS